ncbi:aromatic ring-hydroxylating dioxygenase subunit alpha [Nocardioides koreensis]|uniref:Aromatic ring-hydroxylating dioxygenase subunit alpha n=1 Tax=Nocardioides koreensis TaxID=433651 RepID=A0ABN2ZX95_9ACTN
MTVTTQRVPPAPLDPTAVALALRPFGEARMLPRAAYQEPPVLAWERDHLFGGWLCVGRSDDVAAGGLAATSVGEYGVLLTRDAAGDLRAFENTCRHRGHELLPCGTSATAKAIVCPYHAWTYRLDGTLQGAPGFRRVAGFDPAAFGLRQLDLREWHGWIFVDRAGRGGSFAEHVGELEAIVAPYDAETLVTPVSHDYDVAANWKVVVENFQECYHCSMIHPELCRVSPPESGENIEKDGDWVGGWMDLRAGAETMSLDGRSGGMRMARLDEQERRTVMYVAVLPNLLVSLHPDYVMSHLLTPLSPDLTRIRCSWSFPRDVVAADGFDPSYAVDFWDLTNRQDWAACESVQRGMRSPGFEPGPMAPAEDGVHQFVSFVARAYQGSGPVLDA